MDAEGTARRSADAVPTSRGSAGAGGGLIDGLFSALRLPERVVVAIETVAERLEDVRSMREAVEAIGKQSEDLDSLLPALAGMKDDLGERLAGIHACIVELEGTGVQLDKRVGDLYQEMAALRGTVAGLKDDVQRITDRLPDRNAPGPLERARAVLTGGDA